MRFKLCLLVVVLLAFAGCKEFTFPMFGHQKDLLAKVGGEELYREDITSIFTNDMTAEDSTKILKSYVDNWIKTQLKVKQAATIFEEDQDDINKQIEEYRRSLLLNKYDRQYVSRFVDTLITESQIIEYYNDNKERFLLAGPIVRAQVVRFPAEYRQSKKVRELFKSQKESDFLDFLDIVEKNSFKFDDFTGKWYDLNEVLRTIPFSYKEKDVHEILRDKRFYEFTDKEYTYMMTVITYRQTGEISPLEMVEDVIRQMIYNKRRADVIKNKEDSLYRVGLKDKKIVTNI